MVDIYIMHKVAKAMWIKCLSSIDQCHWKTLFLKLLAVKETLLNKQVLESWTEIYCSKSYCPFK